MTTSTEAQCSKIHENLKHATDTGNFHSTFRNGVFLNSRFANRKNVQIDPHQRRYDRQS